MPSEPTDDALMKAYAAGDAVAFEQLYTRHQAAFPTAHTRAHKYWPTVGRIDNAYGDRNLVCTCPPMEAYVEAASVTPKPEPALPRAR